MCFVEKSAGAGVRAAHVCVVNVQLSEAVSSAFTLKKRTKRRLEIQLRVKNDCTYCRVVYNASQGCIRSVAPGRFVRGVGRKAMADTHHASCANKGTASRRKRGAIHTE